MIYEKATAEIVLFDNFDMITTSGSDDTNTGGGCTVPGWDRGNGCNGNSGNCTTKHAWKG